MSINIIFRDTDYYKYRILLSLGLNAPVLLDKGYHPQQLIILRVPEGELMAAIEAFKIADSKVIEDSMDIRTIMNILANPGHAFVLYPYVGSKKATDILELLYTATKTVRSGGKDFTATALVITESMFFQDNTERFFSTSISGLKHFNTMTEQEVVPADSDLSVAIDQFRNIKKTDKPAMEILLKAAACFCYPQLKRKEDLNTYFSAVDDMISIDAKSHFIEDLSDLFTSKLYDLVVEGKFSDAYELPITKGEILEKSDSCLFYNKQDNSPKFVYMSEAMFKKILGDSTKVFGIDGIKKALQESGILITDNTNTYTVKSPIKSKTFTVPTRMLRFDSKALGMVNNTMHLVNRCELNKPYEEEEVNYEEE